MIAGTDNFNAWIAPTGAIHHVKYFGGHKEWVQANYPGERYRVRERKLLADGWIRKSGVDSYMIGHERHLPAVVAHVKRHHRDRKTIFVEVRHKGRDSSHEVDMTNPVLGDDVWAKGRLPEGEHRVADALIAMRLEEENWERARRRVGLPSDFELHPLEQGIRRLITNPRFKVHATPSRYVQGGLDLHVQPRTHKHIARVTRNNFGEEPRPRDHRWYDTRIAHLEPDEVFGPRPVLNPDSGLHTRIPEKPDDVHMWRGMSHEEWSRAQRTGYIESNRTYNMSNQQDITSFGTHPSTAESYANGFAPIGHGATFHRPAYAVKVVRSPLARPESNGSDYLEVPGRVPLSDVRAVYRGRAWMMSPGEHELSPPRETRGGYWRSGSGVGVRADVAWEKVR